VLGQHSRKRPSRCRAMELSTCGAGNCRRIKPAEIPPQMQGAKRGKNEEVGETAHTSEDRRPEDDSGNAKAILLELCAASVEDAVCAAELGVGRLELNCAFPLGGLTPTVALLEGVRDVFHGPVIAMIRPREGGFVYTKMERQVMYRDAELLLERGVVGIATGFLTAERQIDVDECRRFRQTFPQVEFVCHRAFDLVEDHIIAARQLVDCGFQRILTSGGADDAMTGRNQLRQLQQQFGGQIQILAGGGIRAENVATILQTSGVRQVHSAARGNVSETQIAGGRQNALSSEWSQHGRTCPSTLRLLVDAVRKFTEAGE
jgi:copper homeostasis protein